MKRILDKPDDSSERDLCVGTNQIELQAYAAIVRSSLTIANNVVPRLHPQIHPRLVQVVLQTHDEIQAPRS